MFSDLLKLLPKYFIKTNGTGFTQTPDRIRKRLGERAVLRRWGCRFRNLALKGLTIFLSFSKNNYRLNQINHKCTDSRTLLVLTDLARYFDPRL